MPPVIESPDPVPGALPPLPRNTPGQEAFANYYDARKARLAYERSGAPDADTMARLHQLEAEASRVLDRVSRQADANAPVSGLSGAQL
jgi:hypothetical protein